MSGKIIATIYFYLISAVALVLIVIGAFNVVELGVNSTQYEEYPSRYGGIGRDCENEYPPATYSTINPDGSTSIAPTITPADNDYSKKQRENCEKAQELERKQSKVEDIKNAVTFNLVGIVLFLIHFPMARKWSQN